MPFDIAIAIAKLDLASGTDRPDFDGLRGQYPELTFVFDLLEDTLREAEYARIEHREEFRDQAREYERTIDELEVRVQDMRLAFEQIRELTVDAEITQIIEDVL